MLRSILKSIGLLLVGKHVRQALEREQRYAHYVHDTRHWMSGSFPEVADAMLHVQVMVNGPGPSSMHDNPRYMSAQDCHTSIDQFRERMRSKYNRNDNGQTTIPALQFDTDEGFDVIHKETA